MKKRFQTGGNIHAVPASRQNAEPRTPSGVRPVSSPVTPVQSDVQGVMKNGGEVKNMKKPKKMGFGGATGPMPGPGGRLARQRGGRGVDQGGFMDGGPKGQPGMRYPMRPGADGAPMFGGMGGMGGMDERAFLARMNGGPVPVQQGMGQGAGSMPMGGPGMGAMPRGPGQINNMSNAMMGMMGAGPRAPAMKKGGKVFASSYNDMTGGAGGGMGRLEKTSIAAKTKSQKLKKGGKVKGYADGGELSLGDRIALEKAGFDPETRMKRNGSSYGKAPYESAELPAPKKKAAPAPRPRPKMTPSDSVGLARSEQRMSTDRTNEGIRSQQKSAIDKMLDVARRNGNQREIDRLTALKASKGMKKGGKIEAFEGTARDMAEDKKLAKKYGMSKKAYEKSEVDAKHDKQRSVKGLKMGGKAEMHAKGCKCMACGGMAKMAKGGKVGMTFGKPLPGTKVSSQKIRPTTATGASMKKDGMKGQLRAKASGAKTTSMMKPLGMTKMASGGKVRGAGIAQRGTKFIGEV